MPSAGLTTTSSLLFGSIAAQMLVTAGPVNVTGITVDGDASSNCPSVDYVGIFYSSGSSGTINGVQTLLQNCNNGGIGILAENGAGPSKTVTIENSCIQSNTYFGIAADSGQTPTLTASIKDNYVASSFDGIFVFNTDGSVSGNNVNTAAGNAGIVAFSASSAIQGNTITGTGGTYYGIQVEAGTVISDNTVNIALSTTSIATVGIYVDAPGSSVTSNHIMAAVGPPTYQASGETGIYLTTADATVQKNIIVGTDFGSWYSDLAFGIQLNCNAATVSGNTINGAKGGMVQVPAGFTGVNKIYGAEYTTGGC